ncbi:hypothetical protein [Psychromonas sp. SP041]|uniref:hypothetical protein n=1 Tax=Psychromonas sp. SP041 TaxID=1365007 RepID=UPI0003FA977C|nr:hypothetical protein [Psychromonas sp. SP041]
MPNAANTIIGVPNPPSTTERLDHRDVKILLIVPPKNECDDIYMLSSDVYILSAATQDF